MVGSYYLLLKFGGQVIPLSTSVLREFTIVQDYNKFLPEFRLRIDDATGMFTHIAPFDRNMSSVYVEFALDQESDDKNSMNFLAYISEPGGLQSTPSSQYDITGFLDMGKFFAPDFVRGFSGSIQSNIESIAMSELGVSTTNVSVSLDYDLNLIQPHWTNASFFNYLKDNLIGQNGEYGYKSFVTVYKSQTSFVFRSIAEMITDPVSYNFLLDNKLYQGTTQTTTNTTAQNLVQNPILEYFIYDNYRLYGLFGSKQQNYSYYDFDSGEYVQTFDSAQNYTSLSSYFLIDEVDTTDSVEIETTGRSNDFTSDFLGRVKNNYGNRLAGLVKMWVTTMGLPNIAPGQSVTVFFPHGSLGSNLNSFEYSGYYIVERVVHNFGDIFMTKLLLTRHGVTTDQPTTLMSANSVKKA